MSDTVTSGEPNPANTETAGATPSVATTGTPLPTGTFGGNNRGSGLARGKRPAQSAAPSAASSASNYQPTAIEMITHEREYKNPFAPVEAAPAPAETKPVESPVVSTPEPVFTPAATPVVQPVSTETVKPEPVAAQPAPVIEKKPYVSPVGPTPETKGELNILPPETVKRPAQDWDQNGNRPRRDERPTFRTERDRREGGRSFDPREQNVNTPREPRQPRDPREAREPRQPRDPREARPERRPEQQPRPAYVPKANRETPQVEEKPSGGFIGWLKGLFGSKPAVVAKTEERREHGRGDGHGHHNRHRGGRGRGGENRGPREGGGQGSQPGQFNRSEEGQRGENRFEGGGRRRRGGRGRHGGGGGGPRHDDPRPEGQQGGGAI